MTQTRPKTRKAPPRRPPPQRRPDPVTEDFVAFVVKHAKKEGCIVAGRKVTVIPIDSFVQALCKAYFGLKHGEHGAAAVVRADLGVEAEKVALRVEALRVEALRVEAEKVAVRRLFIGHILGFCEAAQIEVSPERTMALEALEPEQLDRLYAYLREKRAWPAEAEMPRPN